MLLEGPKSRLLAGHKITNKSSVSGLLGSQKAVDNLKFSVDLAQVLNLNLAQVFKLNLAQGINLNIAQALNLNLAHVFQPNLAQGLNLKFLSTKLIFSILNPNPCFLSN